MYHIVGDNVLRVTAQGDRARRLVHTAACKAGGRTALKQFHRVRPWQRESRQRLYRVLLLVAALPASGVVWSRLALLQP